MNLAVRGIDADIRWNSEGTFHKDEHPDLKADYILANPPFNVSDWGGERLREDKRWDVTGVVPPAGNANFAWLQHIVHHLSPGGYAGVVLANGSMSSNASGEGEIRKALLDADLVDCMVALPGQLFYSTPIPVCLWFLARNKGKNGFRARKGEVLFIDARKIGHMVDRTLKDFSFTPGDPETDIVKIADTYHAWRGEKDAIKRRGKYEDIPGFCKSATLNEIKEHGYILTPGRYVGAADEIDDGEAFDDKMQRLIAQLAEQFTQSDELERKIRENLAKVGYGF